MILNERDARHEHILQVARQMMTAARTAPKGKGIDIIEVALITDEDIKLLSDKRIAMVEEHGRKFFLECRMCCIDRNTRTGTRFELRTLRICDMCRTHGRRPLCIEQY